MKKHGFTLVEMLAVISLIAILMLLIVPSTASIIKKNKEKSMEIQIKNIENAGKNWGAENLNQIVTSFKYITLGQLKKDGFIEDEIINPINNKCVSNDTIVRLTLTDGNFEAKLNKDTYKTVENCDLEINSDELLYDKLAKHYAGEDSEVPNTYEVNEYSGDIFLNQNSENLLNYAKKRYINLDYKVYDDISWIKIKDKMYKTINYDDKAIYIRYMKDCSSGTCIDDKEIEKKVYYGLGQTSSSIVTSWDSENNQVEEDLDTWYNLLDIDEYTVPLNLVSSYDIIDDNLTKYNKNSKTKKEYSLLTLQDLLISVRIIGDDGLPIQLRENILREVSTVDLNYASSITFNKNNELVLEQLNLSTNNNELSSVDIEYCSNINCKKNYIRPVINLKPNTKVKGGTGSLNDPYILSE